jgi:hypothetical protein
MSVDLKGTTPESWVCVDCGVNTAPGFPTRIEMEQRYNASKTVLRAAVGDRLATLSFDDRCEVYTIKKAVWKAAGMQPWGGRLCIGCLEKRLRRKLRPKDFPRHDAFNSLPGTERLIERRDPDDEEEAAR